MTQGYHRITRAAATVVAVATVHVSALGDVDVTTLPLATVRTGHEVPAVWPGLDDAPPFGIQWANVIVHLDNGVAVSGQGVGTPNLATQAVWIFEEPAPDDPLSAFGLRHSQFLQPILPFASADDPEGFGKSMAGLGDWLFVGAPDTDVQGVENSGQVHIFRRSASGAWLPFGLLQSSEVAANERFGLGLAFDGATLVVGTPGRRPAPDTPTTGGADLFVVDGDAIGEAMRFTAPVVSSFGTKVGMEVAVDGERFALSEAGTSPDQIRVVHVVSLSNGTPTLEETLVDPIAPSSATKFGAVLAMANGRLAISSPSEHVNGVMFAGAIRIYERRRDHWMVTKTLVGTKESEALGAVAMTGDYLSTGAPGKWVAPYDQGHVWLYRFDGDDLTLLAERAAAPVVNGDVHRFRQGAGVVLGSDRWSFTEAVLSGSTGWFSIQSHRFSVGIADCDGDGVTNVHALINGAEDRNNDGIPDTCIASTGGDCDGDGMGDAVSTLLGPELPPNQATGRTGLSFPLTTDRAAMCLVPQVVPPGSDGLLRGVVADWAAGFVPQPVFVVVYDDPSQVGNPVSLVYRTGFRAAVGYTAGEDRVYFPQPIDVGPPGTVYYLGLGLLALDTVTASLELRHSDAPSLLPTWFVHDLLYRASHLAVEHPAFNFSIAPNAPIACAGLFRSALDPDGNGVPDACECEGDVNHDRVVNAVDLAIVIGAWGGAGPADLDGDGIVHGSDLALLLAAWGDC
ncbi:MAG: hypothetical protein JNL80_16405 [Phycisphaerae bacterium]|nr:hypothetical protein [Phycisphaerae bacterium]